VIALGREYAIAGAMDGYRSIVCAADKDQALLYVWTPRRTKRENEHEHEHEHKHEHEHEQEQEKRRKEKGKEEEDHRERQQ
jgi:hypothetical protein